MKVTSALLSFVCFAVIGTGVAARQAAPRGGGAPVVSTVLTDLNGDTTDAVVDVPGGLGIAG